MSKAAQQRCTRCGRASAIVNVGTANRPRYYCVFCSNSNRHKIDGTVVLFSRLTPKEIGDFSHQQAEAGVRLGFNYHYYSRASECVVIELGILNESGAPLKVWPTDFAFTYNGQPVKSARLEFDAAAVELVDRGSTVLDWLGVSGSPAYPHEALLLLPFLFVDALRRSKLAILDYIAWRRGKQALGRISFDYGLVGPGQFKQGLIFFHVEPPNAPDFTWPEKWGLKADVVHHHIEPQVSEKAIAYKRVPFLPSGGCTTFILAIQFVCITGVCYLIERFFLFDSIAVPFFCGAAYLVLALLVILGLARNSYIRA